jgi:K+-transporting ATPase KdpF subunit
MGARRRLRADFEGSVMSVWTTIALVLAVLVAVYLVWALLRAEDFQ